MVRSDQRFDLQTVRVPVVDELSQETPGKQGVPEKALQKALQIDPALAQIVAAWPTLPDAIKRAMLALIG